MFSQLLNVIARREAAPPPIPQAAEPEGHGITTALSAGVSSEVIAQYLAGSKERTARLDDGRMMLIERFQAEYAAKIDPVFRPLSAALLNFDFALVDDDAPVRAETRLGLAAFKLAKSGPSPADGIIGEYGDAVNFIDGCLSKLETGKKHLVILDGNFPDRDGSERFEGCGVVLSAIEEAGNDGTFVLVRSGAAGSKVFERFVLKYPFVLGVLGKGGNSSLFQWALAQNPDAIAGILGAAE